jgi:lipopolysaccharide assembly outer membrane protein LptD (OstA)
MEHVSIRTAALAALLVATVAAAPGGVTTRDFRIETDQTNSNLNDGSFTMPHRVKFFRPGTDVVGDSAKGNYKAGTVTITGHVVMHDNGQSGGAQSGASAQGGPASLQCDELQVDSKRKIYVAAGNVVYTQGTRRATAQNGRLDQGAHSLDLSGDVRLADGDQTLTAQTVHYNTQTKDVSTSGNPVILTHPAMLPGESPNPILPGSAPKSTLPSAGPTSLPPGEGAKSTLPTPAAKATSKPK